MKNSLISRLLFSGALRAGLALGAAQRPAPIADAHIHYNWNQKENISAEAVVAKLRAENVVLAVVAGTPPELALELREAGGDWIVPLYSPYLTPEHRHNWFNRPEVLEHAKEAMESGDYHGIGEVHLVPGLGPRRDNPIFQGLIALAAEYDAPFLIHTDASSYKFLLPVCQQHAETTFVWAHAGGILPPEQIGHLLVGCPNAYVDLSARDPLRYVNSPITEEDGALLPGWREVVLAYPERFMIGSDAVWPVTQMHSWFSDDTGWERHAEFLNFHRKWISTMPQEIGEQIRIGNARKVYSGH